MNENKKIAKWIGFGGCILTIIGCFLPFATVSLLGFSESITLWGLGGLGMILVIAAALSAIIMLTKKAKLSLITTIIAVLLIVLNLVNAGDVSDAMTYGVGLYLTIAGLVIALIAPFFIKKNK